jgi:Flp pilus assembly protein TadD
LHRPNLLVFGECHYQWCSIKLRESSLGFEFLLIFTAFSFIGGAAFGADAEKKTPLKGEVRSGRNQTALPSARTQSDDPFSTDSAGSASDPLKFSSQTNSSRTSPSARREAFQKSMQRARAGVQSTRNVNTDPYVLKGVVAEQNGDLAGALENFVVSVNNDPTNKESQNALHKVELKFKRKYPAFHAYSSYFTGKKDARLLLNYGVRLYSISCFRQAENLFNRAATLDPNNPNAYFNLGVIYEHDGQLSKALAQYQKSLALFKLHGADLASSVSTQAQDSRGKTLKGAVVKLNRERRRFSGMEDPTNGPQLAQAAVDSVLLQLKGQPSSIPKWPTLGVTQPPGGRPKAASRHVDTCDHCLILRDVEMWPN